MNCPDCFKPLDTSLTSCDRCGWQISPGMCIPRAEHERVVAELEAQRDRAFELTDKAQAAVFRAQERWSEARNEALEDAAQMLLRRFHSMGLIDDFAAAIRSMQGE